MITTAQLEKVFETGGDVYDQDGKKIGPIRATALSSTGDKAKWLSLKVGTLDHAETFVPIDKATLKGTDVHVPYIKAMVTEAPRSDSKDGQMSAELEANLIRHYSLNSDGTEPELFPATSGT
ncbi:hypothetical protein F1C15_15535 (plasmid) [Frigoribacterium sp. NBH87]|uniref:hypothetical protein n=1 Tax=Frigoribacterium sp. NBH87 TaxID=2596916 RepID=UPI0016261CF7|nr:hypothetical protein [Frigoribacterium sp. NBH87]QNE45386.1 hypothetical protein F1C15_15535 [Frigoribacterium sp. NBH87]